MSSTIDTDNQTPCDLGIKCATVTSLLNTQNSADPSNDFVRGRIGGLYKSNINVCHAKGTANNLVYLVQINHAITNVFVERTFQRRAATRNRRVMTRTNIELIVVLKVQKSDY
jgi:hypothetical protein